MRWVAVLLASLLIVTTVGLRFLPAEVLTPLLLTLAALAATNLAYLRLLAWRPGLRAALGLQLYLDLGFLILLLHLSGGIENPLYLLPVFNVVLGGIALSRRQCFILALAGGVVCGTAVWAEWARLIPHYTLSVVPHGEHGDYHDAYDTLYVAARTTLQLVMMLLTAHFVSGLAEHSGAHERGLAVAAEEARAGRELLEQSLEATRTGLRVVDPALKPLLQNQQWARWFAAGTPDEQALAAWSGADGSPPRLTLADAAVRRSELCIPAEGQQRARTFLVTAAPLHDRDGHVDRAVTLVQDVTEEKAMQARMLAASKLAAVGEVAGKLAHEINNPIAIVSAKARILLSDRHAEMSEKVGRELERIVELSDRVAGIARRLLAYGRPSVASRSPIDLRTPVRQALSLVEPQAERQGVRLADHLGERLLLVEASAAEMEQVSLNLFLNALDVMPGGGVLEVLGQGATLADGRLAVGVVVSDTGPGIPEDLRDRVFEPFFTTKEEGRGNGLGLSVCQGIVRAHGGEVEVEGSGRGARFIVRLPALPASPAGADRG